MVLNLQNEIPKKDNNNKQTEGGTCTLLLFAGCVVH